MSIQSVNPTTGEVLETFKASSPEELERIVARAHAAFVEWRSVPLAARAHRMRDAARLLRKHKEHHALTMTLEMGKPIVQAEAEVEKCASCCDYYADRAEFFLAEQPRTTDASKSYVRFDPLGPVLAVMPWNFPYWQVFRFAAPALMAGNAGILKHASNVPRCALAIEKTFRVAGFPEGLFATALIESAPVAGLIADPRIGQSCIAAKRFIAVEAVADRFLDLFLDELRSRRMGDPLARETQVGPQARIDLRDELHKQVEESVKRGAKRLLGGEIPRGKGAFYPPTLLAGVDKGMPAFDQETFGPVAAVVRAKDECDAVRLANDSPFGLGASLWTQDRARAEHLAAQIEAGAVFVNGIVKSDPRLPFGGIKRSGYGRELSEYGIREFVNIKSVWIA